MPRSGGRTRARQWMLQLLYGWEVSGSSEALSDYADRVLSHRVVAERCREHLRRLIVALDEGLPEIDRAMQDAMSNWRIDRLAVIDRNILRIGTAELLHFDRVPEKVAIHEAILLAEKYGSEDSPRFVNGVLDAVYKSRPTADRGS
jgi:N utilization substance protein B